MADPRLVVRRCESADVEVISAREPAGKNYARETYRRQTSGLCSYLVAWLDHEPVGSGELEWADVPELKNLSVAQPYRGQGIGSAIVAAAQDEARPRRGVVIGVALGNPEARRLYERLGFRVTGRTQTYSYTYVDADGAEHHVTETSEYLHKPLK